MRTGLTKVDKIATNIETRQQEKITLPWLQLQTELMQFGNRLGLIQTPTNESLDLRNSRQTVRHRLVLLDLTDDLSGTDTLGEINVVLGALQVIRISVLDHDQVGKVDTDKGDTGWVGRMELLTVISPGLCRVGDGLEVA